MDKVQQFLSDFQSLSKANGVKFWERPENDSMMNLLELNRAEVTQRLLNLTKYDYLEGPLSQENFSDAWCFGQTIKGNEVYIKLTIVAKKKRRMAVCISFHEPTKPLKYHYKH